ncbi:hypothetical protein [Kribbella italica]|uniref:Uncharacterized protein n=1 Tax=Kribbella italica TaxID=1540520 RepID=A0A7W9J100_9ACTN|nr:hypothetical protein [Kribbella italica]MBB5833375.1 hypothetical protein [Kribbella italica]
MSEYKEYQDKAKGKNHKGNTDHRKGSGGCMVAPPTVVVGIGLVALVMRILKR